MKPNYEQIQQETEEKTRKRSQKKSGKKMKISGKNVLKLREIIARAANKS